MTYWYPILKHEAAHATAHRLLPGAFRAVTKITVDPCQLEPWCQGETHSELTVSGQLRFDFEANLRDLGVGTIAPNLTPGAGRSKMDDAELADLSLKSKARRPGEWRVDVIMAAQDLVRRGDFRDAVTEIALGLAANGGTLGRDEVEEVFRRIGI